jgi:hypothetical protein
MCAPDPRSRGLLRAVGVLPRPLERAEDPITWSDGGREAQPAPVGSELLRSGEGSLRLDTGALEVRTIRF